MATLRLFARLRELAGSSRIEIDGSTVGEVVEAAILRVGPEFGKVVATARIWRNGDEAGMEDLVADGDEVALLPPVSGGAVTASLMPEVGLAIAVAVAVAVLLMNLRAGEAWWAATVVGAVGLWIVDVGNQMEARGRPFPAMAVLVASVAGAVISHALGATGLAIALALAVVVVLAWGIGIVGYREISSVAPGVLVAMLAAAAAGSLVLTRSAVAPDDQAIDVFLLVVVLATFLGAVVDRLAQMPFLDPYTATAVTAILVAILAAFFWDLDVAGYLLVGLGIAVTLVAGRGLGALLRTGAVSLTDPAPGIMRGFDGAVLAAAIYFPLIRLVL
jgi:molybdopterin converting factor small subunit